MATIDVEYLIHRLYEYFDVISFHDIGEEYLLWIEWWGADGRIMFPHVVPRDFCIQRVDAEVEYLRQKYIGDEWRQSYN